MSNIDYNAIITQAQEVVEVEKNTIARLHQQIDQDFAKAVELIYKSKGRLIVTGIGKSANIAQKIVSTLNSTGTPAIFMHAADAIHGDLGIILKDDVVLTISKSGNTPEIKVLLPLIKYRGNPLIGMTAHKESFLGQQADYVLNVGIDREACPNNLAPTSSTTSQLVMGDALAVCLVHLHNFGSQDFAKVHPGGSLGKQLYLCAQDIISKSECPQVTPNSSINEVIVEISGKRLGATAVLDQEKIIGIITDGDLRRMLQQGKDIQGLQAKDIMSPSPKTITSDTLLVDALNRMRQNNITQVLVTDNNKYVGVVHLHDILREGIL